MFCRLRKQNFRNAKFKIECIKHRSKMRDASKFSFIIHNRPCRSIIFKQGTEREEISVRLNEAGIAAAGRRGYEKHGEKHVGTSDDGRGILLEIQRDVNISLYIEPTRDKVKKFSPAKRESGAVFPPSGDSVFLYQNSFADDWKRRRTKTTIQ